MNKLKCIYSGVDANNNYGNRDGKEKNFGGHWCSQKLPDTFDTISQLKRHQ